MIVDREFGRTKKGWYPRRLGGGKGEARRSRSDEGKIRAIQREIDLEDDKKARDLDTPMKSDDTPLKTSMTK